MTLPEEEMTPSEEGQAFYAALGLAITQWAYIERALCDVYHAVLDQPNKDISTAAFYAVENFRSKMQMVDAVMRTRFAGSPHLEDWTGTPNEHGLWDRITRASGTWNRLAHHTVVVTPSAKPGKRYRLLPNIWNPLNPKPSPVNPQQGCVLKDLEAIPGRFLPIALALENYAHRLRGQPVPYAGYPAREKRGS